MNEPIIKNALDFLCSEYNFKYNVNLCDNYFNSGGTLIAYSYYNENGCFTIGHFPVRGEVHYFRFENIDHMKRYFEISKFGIGSIQKCELNIFDYETQIWSKYEKFLWFKNPFAWLSDKKILKVLSEVIKAQIKRNNEFFGIKITN